MHSSRMRAGRSLTICLSLLLGVCVSFRGSPSCGCLLLGGSPSGGVPPWQGGASLAGGSPWQGDLLLGSAFFLGVPPFGWGLLLGGLLGRGASLAGGLLLGGPPWQGGLLIGGSSYWGCLLLGGSPWQRGPPSWGVSLADTPP